MKLFLPVLVAILSAQTLIAQLAPEFKVAAKGTFTSPAARNNLAASGALYLAAVSSNVGFDSVNTVKLSNDGGRTWFNVKADRGYNINPKTFEPLPGDWSERYYYSVARPAKDLILVLAADRPKDDQSKADVYGTQYPYLFRSTDEGKSWTVVEIQNPRKAYWNNLLSMADPAVGYLVSADTVGTTISGSSLYKTNDAGLTWKPVSTAPAGINNLQALSDRTVILTTADSLHISTNGGQSWRRERILPDMREISFTTAETGYAAGGIATNIGLSERTIAYRTVDGGRSWQKILDTLEGGSAGNAVHFFDPYNGIILARTSYWQTRDAGKNWSRLPVPYGIAYDDSKAVVMTSPTQFTALVQSAILHASGKYTLTQPQALWSSKGSLDYDLHWTPVKGAGKYRVQLAKKKISGSLVAYDFGIFETAGKFLDTMLTTAQIKFTDFDSNSDYFARVMALSDTLASDWSGQVIIRTPAKKANLLNRPDRLFPADDTTLYTTKVTLKWAGDEKAGSYDLKLTSAGNSPAAFRDEVANNRYGITADSVSVELIPGKTYHWYVRAWAPGFDTTNSSKMYSFRTGELSGYVENGESGSLVPVAPNPAHDVVSISLPEDAVSVSLMSELGVTLDVKSVSGSLSPVQFNISDLASGTYFFVIHTKRGAPKTGQFFIIR